MDRSSVHLFCTSRALSTLGSDTEKRATDPVVVYAVNVVNRLSSNTPLSICDSVSLQRARWTREEVKIKSRTAALKD